MQTENHLKQRIVDIVLNATPHLYFATANATIKSNKQQ